MGTIIWCSTPVRSHDLYILSRRLIKEVDYEYGRLLAHQGEKEEALKHFGYVLGGKAPESNPAGWRGKYSLEVGSSPAHGRHD